MPTPLDYFTGSDTPARPMCPACRSNRTFVGNLHGVFGFKPENVRPRSSFMSNTVTVHAVACAACGHVSLGLDLLKLIGLAGDPDADE